MLVNKTNEFKLCTLRQTGKTKQKKSNGCKALVSILEAKQLRLYIVLVHDRKIESLGNEPDLNLQKKINFAGAFFLNTK